MLNYCNITVTIETMGRTIPSFHMIIDQEINLIMQTYGKKLCKDDRKSLIEVLEICKRHSHACSESARLVPIQAILMAILLEQKKELNSMESEITHVLRKTKLEPSIPEQKNTRAKDNQYVQGY